MRKAAIAGIALFALLGLVAAACAADEEPGIPARTPTATPHGPIPTVSGQPTTTSSGLQIIDLTVGTGAEATATSTITVNYTGYLDDGTVFDTSVGGTPYTQPLSNLITGWKEGIPGMKEGGKRRLIIPPELGYGAQGQGSVPPNATLTFDIELVSVQ
jgi:FKBP-type peptidyl-prolyl cis-trans isomerase